MKKEKTFETAFGICYIYPDKIVFKEECKTDSTERRTVSSEIKKRKVLKRLFILISAFFLYFSFVLFKEDKVFEAIFLTAFAINTVFNIIKNLTFTFPSIIYRDSIKKVSLKRRILYNNYYEIKFTNADGKIKKCEIPLLSVTREDKKEKERAIKILREEGLIK